MKTSESIKTGIKHGLWGYNHHKCRCETCREAARISAQKKRDKNREHYRAYNRERYRQSLGRDVQQKPDEWTEAEVAALIELSRTCTDEQIAEYLDGRGVSAIRNKRHKLRQDGLEITKPTAQHMIPFVIPAQGILLAKTCPGCGKLRDATYFRKITRHHKGKGYVGADPRCAICTSNKGNPDSFKKLRAQERELQNATLPIAFRSGWEFNGDDYEALEDLSRPTFEVAVALGRTYLAVKHKRNLMQVNPRRRRKLTDSHWMIHFPMAMKVLQEHFKSIGEPVPEELWEWNDEQEIAS